MWGELALWVVLAYFFLFRVSRNLLILRGGLLVAAIGTESERVGADRLEAVWTEQSVDEAFTGKLTEIWSI